MLLTARNFNHKGYSYSTSFGQVPVLVVFVLKCSLLKNFHYAPVICNPCPPTYGDSEANMRGNDLLSSPAVTGKCRACDITQLYPHGIYSYKEQDYVS